jgi:hypothetical protein
MSAVHTVAAVAIVCFIIAVKRLGLTVNSQKKFTVDPTVAMIVILRLTAMVMEASYLA